MNSNIELEMQHYGKKEESINLLPNEEKENLQESSIINQIFNKYGYSWFVWISITCTFLTLFVEDIEMTYFAYLLIPFRKKYDLSNVWIIIIHITFSSGCAVGATFAGLLNKYLPRKVLINICLFIILTNHFTVSFIEEKYSFCFIRLTTGFAVGVIDIITLTVLSEYLPDRFKAFLLTFIWIAFTISPTIFLLIMLCIMPNLESIKIKNLMLLTSIFPLICLIVHLFFFRDSPSGMILKGDHYEAFHVLEQMNGAKLTKTERKKLIKEIDVTNNSQVESSLKDIYSGKYLLTTLILSNLWLTSGIVCYGIILISSLTLKANLEKSEDIIKNEMYIRIPSAISYILGAPLVELTIISRKNLLIIINAISTLFLIISVVTSGEVFSWMIGVSLAMNFLNLNICNTYVCEIYNDKLRDLAIGALFTGSNIGSILGLVMVLLDSLGKLIPYYVSICLYGISTVTLFFLPNRII